MRVERDDAYSHLTLDAELERANLDPRDAGLATRIVYGTLAWRRAIDHDLSRFLKNGVKGSTDVFTRAVLRAAVYQLRHLDRVPAHAVVDSAVEAVKQAGNKRKAGFVNAVLRNVLRKPWEPPAYDGTARTLGIRYSLPDSLADRAIVRFGRDGAEAWARSINLVAPLTLRAIMSRISPDELTERVEGKRGGLAAASVVVEGASSALTAALDDGICTVQDEGSQLCVELIGDLPTSGRIWDACAGQGVKTVQLLDTLVASESSAELVASDKYGNKLQRLQTLLDTTLPKAASRVTTVTEDVTRDADRGLFDLVLVDAPCSGLGLVRRHPETRWRRDLDDIEALAALQQQILSSVAGHVKPGGVLLYAVCTNTLEETHGQVEQFLEANPCFALEPPENPPLSELVDERGRLELHPHTHGTDGFFAARLRRTE